jgi:hypothetical protein
MKRRDLNGIWGWAGLATAMAVGASIGGCTAATCEDTATCATDGATLGTDGVGLEDVGDVVPGEASADAAHEAGGDATLVDSGDATLVDSGDATFVDSGDVAVDATGDSTLDAVDAGSNDADADGTIDQDSGDASPDSRPMTDAPSDAPDSPSGDGCRSIPENCTNGVDDNCDGKIDCADPECVTAGFVCVTSYSGWLGPVILADEPGTTPGAGSLTCPAVDPNNPVSPDYGTLVRDGVGSPNIPGASCACNCGAPSDAGCPGPTIELFSDPDCGTSIAPPTTITGCSLPPSEGSAVSVRITAPDAQTAACAQGVAKSVPAWNWTTSQRACQPVSPHAGVSGGCSTGQYCVGPPPTSLFTAGLCIYQTGDQSCSKTPKYPNKHASYDGGVDTRDCDGSTCSCSPGQVSCTVKSVTFDPSNDGCETGYTKAIVGQSECLYTGIRYVSASVTASPPTSCTVVDAGAAASTGTVTPTGEWTFCCTQ